MIYVLWGFFGVGFVDALYYAESTREVVQSIIPILVISIKI